MQHSAWRKAIGAIGIGAGSLAFIACGGSSKPAEDPSTASAEEAPKWDDSSESADRARHPHFASNASSDDEDGSKPAAAPPPPSSPAKQRRADEYDREATEMVIRRAARQVKENCGAATDEDGKASGPWGKALVTVNLGHNGRSKGATISAPFEGKPTGRCALQAFANLMYPPWAGADTSVEWEVEIPQAKGAK